MPHGTLVKTKFFISLCYKVEVGEMKMKCIYVLQLIKHETRIEATDSRHQYEHFDTQEIKKMH